MIYEGKEPNERQVRIDYYDWWSNRFADAYFGEIQNWCHSNHLLSGGHLDNEDETLGAVKYGYGHVLRQFRKMDVPGVDVIWRQIWPGRKMITFLNLLPLSLIKKAHDGHYPNRSQFMDQD